MAEAATNTGATANTKLNPEELRATQKAQEITAQFTSRMQNGGLVIPVERLAGWQDQRVLMIAPKAFNVTLNDHRQVAFKAGVNSVPLFAIGLDDKGSACQGQAIAEHWYVKAHNAEVFNAPNAATAPLGYDEMPDTVKIGQEVIPTQQFVIAAQAASGLSLPAWNGLPPDERQASVEAIVNMRQTAAEQQQARAAAAKEKTPPAGRGKDAA